MGTFKRTCIIKIDWSEVYKDITETLADYEGLGDPELKGDPQPLYDMLDHIKAELQECIISY